MLQWELIALLIQVSSSSPPIVFHSSPRPSFPDFNHSIYTGLLSTSGQYESSSGSGGKKQEVRQLLFGIQAEGTVMFVK